MINSISKWGLLGGLFAAALSGTVFAVPAQAAQLCGDHAKLVAALKHKYQEVPSSLGITTNGQSVMEIYTSQKGTWTVVVTTAKGKSCIMAAGHSWEDRNKVAFMPKS